ncbi:cytochrome c1 [Pseudoponticoccus marisrubri]|uniref:Cytochrome c1 n=1 Tax=Pseudoponticoccus marisrubri TaxID=1685382 RepID=A0A0W7WPQ3_9RHOB|nr:cytochrome c1 [Pseudoponticoccus marisrubri]KUF12573.1 cytochrome C [Pseudoponticoccus marisrubri]
MFKKLTLAGLLGLGLTSGAFAAGGEGHTEDYAFSFEGPFGTWDEAQLQRGLQVYTEICSACHGMQYVPIRTLEQLGYSEEQVIAYAESFPVIDPASNPELVDPDTGDVATLKPTDHFPANNALNAPDLSLMAKARAGFHGPYGLGLNQLFNGMGGAEYIASLLTHYTGDDKTEAGAVLYENTTYGGYFGMAPPLYGDDVVYADGTPATVEQEAKDVAAFLMWAAEPKMMERQQAGFVGVFFLVVLSVLLYLVNKRIWRPIKYGTKA